MTRRRHRLASVGIAFAIVTTLVTVLPEVAVAAPEAEFTPRTEKSVPVKTIPSAPVGPDAAEEKALKGSPKVEFPAPATTELSLGGTQQRAAASRPIRVSRKDNARAANNSTIRVEVLPKRLDGPAFRLSGAEDQELAVEVDYSGFRDAYGGDWASRLKLAVLPDCALTTPDSLDCQPKNLSTRNDGSGTLTADVAPGPNQLFAVTATASSGAGDYQASSMSPGSTWSAGASSGDFSWEYDMDAPPSLEGPEPDLQLSYSSGNVDARTSATNNQPGWAGEGFDFNPGGYIERRYASCSTDTKDSNNTKKTGDLCWRTDNATLQLNGSGGEMVRDDVSGTWTLRGDDGSKIEKLSNKDNGDNNGEAWKITTRDGTQYFFGLNKLPGWTTGKQTTNSAWTVPVFGNHSGEDCYKAGSFDTSWCQQAWRWNLDYVVDPHGNTMSYFYKTETNNYSRNLTATKVSNYVRDGYIERIDYGQRDGEVYTKPAVGQVAFTVADRCIPGTQCVTTQPQNWPDTPLDQLCTSTTNCGNKYTPSFWTQKRLAKVTTKVWNGTGFKNVDEWTLTHSYPAPGDGTRAGMWLDSIQRTGLVGGTATLPATTFEGIQLSNRVDGIEGIPPMNWWRLKAIRTETGAELAVNYLPKECAAPGALPAEDNNTKRCHPLKWTPDSLDDLAKERTDWFHKYVVSDVTEKDLTTGLAPEVTKINYVGTPAWHHDEEDGLVPAERKSWSQWRGYDRVQTLKGQQGGEQEQTEVLYFRGMDEDKTAAGALKDVKVVDSNGVAVDDSNQLAGSEREVITYDKAGGKVISREITDQWVSAPTATRVRSWGTTKAYKVGESAVRRSEIKPDGSALKSGSNNVFDAGGLVQRKEELHNLDDPNDDTCTRYTYAHNAATHMMDAEVQEETVRVACDKTPNLPADLVSIERTYYDNSDTFGAAPVKGDPTRRDVFNGWVNGAPVFKTLGRAKFDIYGRAVEATDVAGKTSTTTYESTVGGPVTKVTTTNPLGQKSSTEYETAWGEPIAITDTNNKRTEKLHDPLGRVIKSWLPGRDRSQSPSTEHSYLIRTNGPNVVTNKTLQPNGEYTTEIELYDGQMRERQSQEPAPGGGRVITDTIYDSRGLEVKTNGPFYNDAPPGTDVVTPDEAMLPTQRVFEYDGEGRLTAEILKVEGTEKWRTTHSYDGRQYSVDPPDGETPTTKITDAEGRLVELRQYKGNAPTGDYDKTTYTYTPHGQLETVTDPAGNVWRHEYDMLGREIKVSDPDRGVTEITYDNYDQVATKKDATGKVLAFAYDDIGRTTAVHEGSLAGPKLVEWGFDKLPDGTSVPGVATSSTRYVNGNAYTQAITSVDSGNRPTGMSITIPASEGKLAGTYKFATNYKADGDVADTTLPAVAGLAEEKLTFGYNSLGLPTTLTGQTSYVTNTSYTPYSEPQTVTLSAGGKWVKRSAEYEIGTRRVQRTITERETPGRVVSNVSYTYDAAGNITRIHNQPGADTGEVPDTQCFQHDYLRRMTGAWTPRDGNCAAAPSSANLGGAAPYWHGWTYDKAGNRTSETKVTPDGKTTSSVYTYPAPGQAQPHAVQKVTTTGPSGTKVDEFGYDPTGNTTSRKLGTAPGQTLEWDAEGLLTKVTEGSKVTSYVYDADGNRLIRRDSTGVTLYLGATEVLLNPAGALQATRSYVHDDETVAIRTSNGKLHWLDSNHVGTAEVSIDADTQEVSRRRTDPFGGARGTQPTSWPGQKGFVGGTIDGDTGLTQLGERAYDTATGRFISADPEIDYVEPQQLNAFAYANNNPVTFSDPDGRYWVVVLIPIAVRVLVPVLTRVLVPVLRRVFVWVAKQVVRFIGWLLKKLVSTKWVQVAKTVTVIVAKWVVKWVAKTIQRIKKSKVWKEAKKKIAKAIGKKNVERLKKAREKVRKWVNKWKAKKKKGPNKPKEQKQPRKRQPKKKTEPRPDLYAIANASGPQIKKEADYEKVGDMVLSQEGKDIEDIKGFSTYNSPENLEKRLSTSGMHLYRLPKDAKLPEGLDWVFDNNPEGHHTIYASRNMSFEEYKSKIAGLEWQKVKKYPKKKSR